MGFCKADLPDLKKKFHIRAIYIQTVAAHACRLLRQVFVSRGQPRFFSKKFRFPIDF